MTVYSDTFDRPNSTNVIGTPEVGGPYTVVTGTWGINNNSLYNSVNGEGVVTFPGVSDVDFTITIGVHGSNIGVLFRGQDANNIWMAQSTGSGLNLQRRRAGTFYWQAGTNRQAVAGDRIRVQALGKWIHCSINDVVVLSAEDFYYNASYTLAGYQIRFDVTSRIADGVLAANTALPSVTSEADAAALSQASAPADNLNIDPFLYRGRDTKIQDEGAVA